MTAVQSMSDKQAVALVQVESAERATRRFRVTMGLPPAVEAGSQILTAAVDVVIYIPAEMIWAAGMYYKIGKIKAIRGDWSGAFGLFGGFFSDEIKLARAGLANLLNPPNPNTVRAKISALAE